MLTIFFSLQIYIVAIERSSFAPRGRAWRETVRARTSPGEFSPRKIFTGTEEPRSPTLTVTMARGDGNGARVSSSLLARRSNASPRYVSNFQYLFSTYLPLSLSLTRAKVQMSATSLRTMTSLARGSDFLPSLRRTRLKGLSTTLARRSRTISPIPMYDPR